MKENFYRRKFSNPPKFYFIIQVYRLFFCPKEATRFPLKKKLAGLYKGHYTTLKYSPRPFRPSFSHNTTVPHPPVAFVLSSRYGSSFDQNRYTNEPGLHCVTSSVDHRGYVVIYWGNELGWRA